MTSGDFDELNERNLGRFLLLNPDCATIFGRHDPYDRHLPDGSFRKIQKNLELLTEWRNDAEELASDQEFSADQTISLEMLRYALGMYRFAIYDYPLWKMRPEALENPGSAMLMTLVREYAPMDVRLESMAHRIGELPRYLEQFRTRFKGARSVRAWTRNAVDSCSSFGSMLDTVEGLARKESDGAVQSLMTRNVALAKEELREHESWLSGLLQDSVDDFAMGRRKFAKMMRIRGIDMSAQDLVRLAEESLAGFRSRREVLTKRMTSSGSFKDARRSVLENSPDGMEEVLTRTEDAVGRAKQFVLDNDLMTVPTDCRIHVMRTPEFLEGSTPTAATYLPAVLEESQETVFLVTTMDDQEQLKSTWNYTSIDSTAVHEAYPGHHHQGVMSNRKPWMHQLPHITYTPETMSPPYESQEGWATYCEEMMHDKGFLGTDRHEYSMLEYAIWISCRVLNEVKLSCGEATIDEMVDRMVRETGCPRASAETDVVGFSNMPGYGICYLVGKHKVTGLKLDLQAELGERFSEKRFHDLVAENGNLPFRFLEKVVRDSMVGGRTTG